VRERVFLCAFREGNTVLDRRTLLAFAGLAAPTLSLSATPGFAQDKNACVGVDEPRDQFLAMAGEKSFLIQVGGSHSWRADYQPDKPLFIGSAFKSFVLTRYLQSVEMGAVSLSDRLPINDDIRSLSSPVFGADADPAKNLQGEVSARTLLEAMIAHSDNTAADAILRHVGVEQVRHFIAAAGLTATRIPDSTRRAFSYFGGAPPDTDQGWAGMKRIMAGEFFGPPRSAVNDRQTMVSSATDMVSYYRRVLASEFFVNPNVLTEFKRISAMADMIAMVVPPDIAAYAKGGSVDWQDFHAISSPGQMMLGRTPVTFCFTLNWTGPDDGVPKMLGGFKDAVAGMLKAVATCFG
jgi:beta-lactamase class A